MGVQKYHRDGDMGCRGSWKTWEMGGKRKRRSWVPIEMGRWGKGVLEDQRDKGRGCTASWGTMGRGKGVQGISEDHKDESSGCPWV